MTEAASHFHNRPQEDSEAQGGEVLCMGLYSEVQCWSELTDGTQGCTQNPKAFLPSLPGPKHCLRCEKAGQGGLLKLGFLSRLERLSPDSPE